MKIVIEFNNVESRWELVNNGLEGFRQVLKIADTKEELQGLERSYHGL